MSRFTTTMYANAASSTKGFITGDPDAPLRQSWAEVHERARSIAGALAAVGPRRQGCLPEKTALAASSTSFSFALSFGSQRRSLLLHPSFFG